jgi:hypothetical protein
MLARFFAVGLVVLTCMASTFGSDFYVSWSSGHDPVVAASRPGPYIFSTVIPGLTTVPLRIETDEEGYTVLFLSGSQMTARQVCEEIVGQVTFQAGYEAVAADAVLAHGRRYVRLTRLAREDGSYAGAFIRVLGGGANEILGFDTATHWTALGTSPDQAWRHLHYAASLPLGGSEVTINVAPSLTTEPYVNDFRVRRPWSVVGTVAPGSDPDSWPIIESDYVNGEATVVLNSTANLQYLSIRGRQTITEEEVWGHEQMVFTNAGNGLYLSAAATVEHCDVQGNASSGISIPCASLMSGTPKVVSSTIHDNRVGLIVAHGFQVIQDNRVERNWHQGINAFCGSMALLRNNLVVENGSGGIEDAGIWLGHHFEGACDNNPMTIEIDGNTVALNNGHGIGMNISASSLPETSLTPVIHNNIIALNAGYGLLADTQAPGITIPALQIHDFTHPIVFDNAFFKNYTPFGGPEWPESLTEAVLLELQNIFGVDPRLIGDFYLDHDSDPPSPCLSAGGRMRENAGNTDPSGQPDRWKDNIDNGFHHHD